MCKTNLRTGGVAWPSEGPTKYNYANTLFSEILLTSVSSFLSIQPNPDSDFSSWGFFFWYFFPAPVYHSSITNRFSFSGAILNTRTEEFAKEMARMARSCIQSLLKLVNSGLGMVGIALIVYSVWMFRVWLRYEESAEAPIPW